MGQKVLVSVAVLVLACASGACSSGGDAGDPGVGPSGLTVGAPCTKDVQCSFKCDNNTCTKACKVDLDCPAGTVCITSDSGKCAIACVNDTGCAGIGGAGTGTAAYVCREVSKTDGTKANVCRQP